MHRERKRYILTHNPRLRAHDRQQLALPFSSSLLQLSLDTVLELQIPEKNDESQRMRYYTLEDLRELQNKLMLMSGKGDQGQNEVDHFVEVHFSFLWWCCSIMTFLVCKFPISLGSHLSFRFLMEFKDFLKHSLLSTLRGIRCSKTGKCKSAAA